MLNWRGLFEKLPDDLGNVRIADLGIERVQSFHGTRADEQSFALLKRSSTAIAGRSSEGFGRRRFFESCGGSYAKDHVTRQRMIEPDPGALIADEDFFHCGSAANSEETRSMSAASRT